MAIFGFVSPCHHCNHHRFLVFMFHDAELRKDVWLMIYFASVLCSMMVDE